MAQHSLKFHSNSCAKSLIFLISAVGYLSACQKATPNLSSLTSLSGVTLDQTFKTVVSTAQPISISGKCNKNFSSIEASSNSGKTWTAIRNLDSSAQINCASSGNFSTKFTLTSASASLVSQIEAGGTVAIMFRGNGSFGASVAQALSISKSGPTPAQSITYGENLSTNASYRLTSRLSGAPSTVAINNGTYILKSNLRSR